MKRWYGAGVPCPDCEEVVEPEFYDGFWRIPIHNEPGTIGDPCGGYGKRVVAR